MTEATAVDRQEASAMIERLRDESELCANEGADDISDLLDEATETIERLTDALTASEKRNEEAVRLLRAVGNGGVFCLMAESSDDADVWYDQRDQFLEGK